MNQTNVSFLASNNGDTCSWYGHICVSKDMCSAPMCYKGERGFFDCVKYRLCVSMIVEFVFWVELGCDKLVIHLLC